MDTTMIMIMFTTITTVMIMGITTTMRAVMKAAAMTITTITTTMTISTAIMGTVATIMEAARRGRVDVFDIVKRKHVLVPAGRSYFVQH